MTKRTVSSMEKPSNSALCCVFVCVELMVVVFFEKEGEK